MIYLLDLSQLFTIKCQINAMAIIKVKISVWTDTGCMTGLWIKVWKKDYKFLPDDPEKIQKRGSFISSDMSILDASYNLI